MVWQLVGIIFTTTVIAVVFRLDERAEKAYDEKLD
jgi:hypothetical protein